MLLSYYLIIIVESITSSLLSYLTAIHYLLLVCIDLTILNPLLTFSSFQYCNNNHTICIDYQSNYKYCISVLTYIYIS